MRVNLLIFVILLLFQYNQGALHFNANKHLEDVIQLRNPRQNVGGSGRPLGRPESYSYNFTNDDHQYARADYIGKGSKVTLCTLIYIYEMYSWHAIKL